MDLLRDDGKNGILWANDKELGYVFFCPYCQYVLMDEKAVCQWCGGAVDWEHEVFTRKRPKWPDWNMLFPVKRKVVDG